MRRRARMTCRGFPSDASFYGRKAGFLGWLPCLGEMTSDFVCVGSDRRLSGCPDDGSHGGST
jgi:hypothetical protein